MEWITYCGEQVEVSDEVAAFLREDEILMRKNERQFCRHWDIKDLDDDDAYEQTARRQGRDAILDYLIRKEQRQHYLAAVETLSAAERELYEYLFVQGMTQTVAAKQLNIAQSTVSYRKCKIVEKLRNVALATYEGVESGKLSALFCWWLSLLNIRACGAERSVALLYKIIYFIFLSFLSIIGLRSR